jgi:hypothetical protein
LSAQKSERAHSHEFRYYGATNLYFRGEAVGVVDVWRCVDCKAKGIELRAQGLNNLSAEAGFPVLDGPDTRWVIFVCNAEEQPKFEVLNVHAGDHIEHECVEAPSHKIKVSGDYGRESKDDRYHVIACIDNYINANFDLATGEAA